MQIAGVLEPLPAGLMLACAEVLRLSILELARLVQTPRKDALAGLITVLRDQHYAASPRISASFGWIA